ncbi:hypothetical protein Moror_2147 [Moniliophthora roreri MCA 2997]|uniref:Uncharacterized protein n=1 Tax=Moniliophthora roreri (strain MCA 2997) TaxID=1381753 RepID=V2XWB9_MONRO|nr:hypothetical protein Moror_2147 [Moniliophthora roreri MCA 2997]
MNRWEKAAKGSFESAVASELMKSEKPGTIITLQKCPFALTAPKQSTPSSIPEPVLSLVALAPMDPGHLQSFLSLYEDLFRRLSFDLVKRFAEAVETYRVYCAMESIRLAIYESCVGGSTGFWFSLGLIVG